MRLQVRAKSGLGGEQNFDNREGLHPLIREAIKDFDPGEGWILIDLRPLGHKFNRRNILPARDLVYGYDILVLVPETHSLQSLNTTK